MTWSRRDVIKGLGLVAAAAVLPSACSKSRRVRLAPVHVSRDRVLRTVVGLRPFRPSGFVVRSERLGAQTIVHNYGHGGAGVTLSWGTSQLAVEEVLKSRDTNIAVIGCGAVGLATARLLQQRGLSATIYARELPPNTTSNIAGARWYPFDVFDSAVATPEFLAALWAVSRVSYAVFRRMLGPEYGVFLRPTYACRSEPFARESLLNFDSPIADLLHGLRDMPADENPFPRYPIVRTFESMMIEPATYLAAIIRDYERAGGSIIQRHFVSAAEFATLSERTIVNCTGLGAATLFGDVEMYPIKGQLTILKPQPEVDYLALPPDLYMFPRKDGIVLGGTFEHHVASLEPDLAAEARIMSAHARFFAQ
jgi:D-amino-acid oxidase